MGFTYWTYRRPFALKGQAFEVKIGCGLTDWHTRLVLDGREIARDHTHILGAQVDYRNHEVTHTLPDGSVFTVESGWVNWFTVGIAVRLNGELVHESHPGRRLAWPMLPGRSLQAYLTAVPTQSNKPRGTVLLDFQELTV